MIQRDAAQSEGLADMVISKAGFPEGAADSQDSHLYNYER